MSLSVAIIASFSFVSGLPTQNTRSIPGIPSTDAFYQPPAGFEQTTPGTILRNRPVVVGFLGLIPDPVEAYQLLYRTTAINGSAIATVTTVFKPLLAHNDRFVSFQTAYDSSASICDPSYNYQLGALQTDLVSAAEQLLLQTYLLSGYIVASPDYEGPDAAFTAGHLSGMGVLDGMRAVANFKTPLGLTTSRPMIVGVGYSGGALATGWAASLQPTYAVELNMKGWIQGGTPADLMTTLEFIDGTIFSGFELAAVAGLSKPSAYGALLQPLLNSIVTPLGRSKLNFGNSNCVTADILAFFEQSILSTSFQSLGDSLLSNPLVAGIMQQNSMGLYKNETPTAPIFLYHASQDEIVPYAGALKLYTSWCNNGANVKFTTFGNGGHVTTEIVGLPDSLAFTKAAFDGTLQKGCSSNAELNSILNPLALGIELEPVLVNLVQILLTAGVKDVNIINNIQTLLNSA